MDDNANVNKKLQHNSATALQCGSATAQKNKNKEIGKRKVEDN